MNRSEALELINKYVRNPKLINHMIVVGTIMKGLAIKLDKNQELWEVVGILHDIDFEQTKNEFHLHGLKSADLLKEFLPEEGLHAIKAHNWENTGTNPESQLDKGLLCSDAMAGLIIPSVLVLPDKKLVNLKAKSVRKRFKAKDFAANVDRERIKICEELGIPLNDFIDLSIEYCRMINSEIGL